MRLEVYDRAVSQSGVKAQTWIVIPALNEAPTIESVIRSLASQGWQNILVVNDGSTDETAERASHAGAMVLNLLINRGQGAALRAGIEHLKESIEPEIIVTFDADGQHLAEDVDKLVNPVWAGRVDVSLGSRFLRQNDVPLLRRCILWAGVFFTWIVSDIFVTDTHNGLRALSRQAYRTIRIHHRGMEHASEILDEIKKHKLRFEEVPVRILYTSYARHKGQRLNTFFMLGVKFIVKKLIA